MESSLSPHLTTEDNNLLKSVYRHKRHHLWFKNTADKLLSCGLLNLHVILTVRRFRAKNNCRDSYYRGANRTLRPNLYHVNMLMSRVAAAKARQASELATHKCHKCVQKRSCRGAQKQDLHMEKTFGKFALHHTSR